MTLFVGKVSGVSLRVRFPGATWAGRFGVGVKKNGVLSLWRGQKSGLGRKRKDSEPARGGRLQAADLHDAGIMFNTMSTHEYTLSIDVVH